MRKRLLGTLGALLAGAGLVFAQAWSTAPSTTTAKEGWSHDSVKVGKWSAPKAAEPKHHAPECPPACPPECPSPCPPSCCPDPCAPLGCPEPCDYQEDAPFNICNRIWLSGETLVWWLKDGKIDVPLVTSTTDPFSTGILGIQGTFVVYGNNEQEHNAFVGGRLSGGYILNEARTMAVEASAFALQEKSDNFSLRGDNIGSGIFARPYTDTVAGQGASALLSFPGAFSGGITIESTSELWGAEVNFIKNLFRLDCVSMDFLAGFRYMQLDEDITINDTFLVLNAGIGFFNGVALPEGNAIIRTDIFETENRFYGGQIGTRLEYRWGCFYALGKLKVAIGDNSQEVNVDGQTSLFVSDTLAASTPGGLLALATNIGSTTRDEFTVVPEAAVNVGWHVTPRIRIYAGYTFIYWSDVLRPGEQIDLQVNPGILPTAPTGQFGVPGGPQTPRVLLRSNDFFAHGMNFGVAFRF
jgi:hypothetical protein